MKLKLQFLGTSPIDVEGFPKAIKRTKEGALNLKPSQVLEITKDEFAFIQKTYPELKFYQFPEEAPAIKTKKAVEKKEKKEPKAKVSKKDKSEGAVSENREKK